MVCQGKYSEHQIVFMQLTKDFSAGAGFALTTDTFCTGGEAGDNLIPYKKITRDWDTWCMVFGFVFELIFSKTDYEKVKKLIEEVAKNF